MLRRRLANSPRYKVQTKYVELGARAHVESCARVGMVPSLLSMTSLFAEYTMENLLKNESLEQKGDVTIGTEKISKHIFKAEIC